MHLLVTGATGFLGSRLVREIAAYETISQIIATGRTLSSGNTVDADNVEYLLGDLTDRSFVRFLFLRTIDVVVNCASLSAPWGAYKLFFQSNCISQCNLIEESRKAKVKRFVYISSPSIYFNFQDLIGIKESDPLPKKMVNHYAVTKRKAEQLLEDSGLNYVVLRPRALIGSGDTVIMPRLLRSYQEGKLRIIGSGNNLVDFTSVSNMINAIWLAINTDDENCNEAYNISNGEPISLWESINNVLHKMGYQGVHRTLPYSLLYVLAYCMEWKTRLFNQKEEPVLTRYSVGILSKTFTMNIEKARIRLKYEPIQTTDEAINEFVQWKKQVNNDG